MRVLVYDLAYSEATLEAALLCFKYHKESNTTYQERLQLLSYVQRTFGLLYLLYCVYIIGEARSYW